MLKGWDERRGVERRGNRRPPREAKCLIARPSMLGPGEALGVRGVVQRINRSEVRH